MRSRGWRAMVVLWMAALTAGAATQTSPVDLDSLLRAVSSRVEAYYTRAQSIVCVETVRLQPLNLDWSAHEVGRTLVYDLRVEWDAATADGDSDPEPRVVRQLRTINGRPPKPDAEPGCMDPKPVSLDSLAMLLPRHRGEYAFKPAGSGRVDKRAAFMFDYHGRTPSRGEVTWKGDCVSVDLPGHFGGRVWVDPATGDVLRLDEELVGMFEFRVPPEHSRFGAPGWMTIERARSSTRFRQVAFHDPEETLMLPESIDSFQVVRNAGVPRLRVVQTFSDYRRFLTAGRLVK